MIDKNFNSRKKGKRRCLDCCIANPRTPSREIEQNVGVFSKRALIILKQNKFRPYRIQSVHGLLPEDRKHKIRFSKN